MSDLVAPWAGGQAILILVMAAAWVVQRRTGQGAWVDAFWSFGVAAAGCWTALAPTAAHPDPNERQVLVAALIAVWGARLAAHLAQRAATAPRDARYLGLEHAWGDRAAARMFGFLMLQALAGGVLLTSLTLAARNPAPDLSLKDAAGAALLLAAVVGEGLADRQLAAFKARPDSAGRICQTGLWAWSRHPNYFFEWLGWCAWPLIAIDLGGGWPWGWLALLAPAYMYWLLTRVSGVPMAEEHMRRTRPEAFADYASRTPAFFPAPPRRPQPRR